MCKSGAVLPATNRSNVVPQECSISTKTIIDSATSNNNSSLKETNNFFQNLVEGICKLKEQDEVPSRSTTSNKQKSNSNHRRHNFWQQNNARNTTDRKLKIQSQNEEKFWENLFSPGQKKRKESSSNTALVTNTRKATKNNLWQEILHDCTKGDKKLLRAIGRTAFVNAVVAITALTGGAVGVVCYATGGAITARRFIEGAVKSNSKEMVKSLTVFGCAGTASLMGQLIAGALMTTIAGVSLPVAAAVAFGVGCTSGITAGALSEWGVDCAWIELGNWFRRLSIIDANAMTEGRCNILLRNTNLGIVLLQSAPIAFARKSSKKPEKVPEYGTDIDAESEIESANNKQRNARLIMVREQLKRIKLQGEKAKIEHEDFCIKANENLSSLRETLVRTIAHLKSMMAQRVAKERKRRKQNIHLYHQALTAAYSEEIATNMLNQQTTLLNCLHLTEIFQNQWEILHTQLFRMKQEMLYKTSVLKGTRISDYEDRIKASKLQLRNECEEEVCSFVGKTGSESTTKSSLENEIQFFLSNSPS
eukprot:CAMPEP_0194222388 /NCGR_PEP_ID=MMETSP0156-20130528/32825_1 /TAXON_ID=33649 /ORGANISM="Thalassionema nitzschioides, Strain L26-B" /LENGTH=534 /DNA_ID=CAMNT_0038953155 /DNA_START=100 /DNA_END=1704 /DNA_ORIENTATION=-